MSATPVEAYHLGRVRTPIKHTPEREFFDDIARLRGHCDPAAFKQLFLQLLMIRCVATASGAGSALWIDCRDAANLTYAGVADVLGRLNDGLGLAGLSRFDALTRVPFGDELVRALISRIAAFENGDDPARAFPRLFDEALRWFALGEGRHGAASITPETIARLLVELAAPAEGVVLDPCCGCGGLLVRAQRFATSLDESAVLDLYGQEADAGVRWLAQMNFTANSIHADLGERAADTLLYDSYPTLRADFVIADPPFGADASTDSDSDSAPPQFAWIQHCINRLAPGGLATVTSPVAALSGTLYGEAEYREKVVRGGLLDCIIALPKGLLSGTKIPVFIWVLARDRSGAIQVRHEARGREGETLLIDAQDFSRAAGRHGCPLESDEITRIVNTYHAWKSPKRSRYADVPGYCRSVTMGEIAKQGFDLSPSRYIELMPSASDGGTLDERIRQFKLKLADQLNSSARLDAELSAWLQRTSDEI